jgi:hypothetical protein
MDGKKRKNDRDKKERECLNEKQKGKKVEIRKKERENK